MANINRDNLISHVIVVFINIVMCTADNKEKRNAWIKAMIETETKLNNRMFKVLYDIVLYITFVCLTHFVFLSLL